MAEKRHNAVSCIDECLNNIEGNFTRKIYTQ